MPVIKAIFPEGTTSAVFGSISVTVGLSPQFIALLVFYRLRGKLLMLTLFFLLYGFQCRQVSYLKLKNSLKIVDVLKISLFYLQLIFVVVSIIIVKNQNPEKVTKKKTEFKIFSSK